MKTMNLYTWKEEFFSDPITNLSVIDALKHSIKKWTGLLPQNLKKHNVAHNKGEQTIHTIDHSWNEYFYIDDSSCALCKNCQSCKDCPIASKIRILQDQDGCYTPYVHWLNTNDPQPMITKLTKALKKMEKYAEKYKNKD